MNGGNIIILSGERRFSLGRNLSWFKSTDICKVRTGPCSSFILSWTFKMCKIFWSFWEVFETWTSLNYAEVLELEKLQTSFQIYFLPSKLHLPERLKWNTVLWKGKRIIFSLTALYPVLLKMISCRTIIKITGCMLLSLEANDTLQDLRVFVFYQRKSNVSMSPGVLFRLFLILLGLLLLNKTFWVNKEQKSWCLCWFKNCCFL